MSAVVQRAAVLVKPLTTDITSASISEPVAGQVRVRLQGRGVCASRVGRWFPATGIDPAGARRSPVCYTTRNNHGGETRGEDTLT